MKKLHLRSSAKSGFTMVELSFAMAFIAVLLIAIAITATSLVSVYQKGLSIKAVNSVGRNLIDEFTRAINAAPSVDTVSLCNSLAPENVEGCIENSANGYIFHEQRSTPNVNGESEQYNGIFCTGYYSYIWNTKAGIENNKTVSLRYWGTDGLAHTLPLNPDDPNPDTKIRLARIVDRTYHLCSAVMTPKYDSIYGNEEQDWKGQIDITSKKIFDNGTQGSQYDPIPTPVEGFLNMFDTDLLLGDLKIFPISQDAVTLRGFLSGTFVLTTIRGSTEILASGDYCDPNGERDLAEDGTTETSSNQLSLGSEFNYCAINKFNFAARTAGSGV